MHSIKRINKVHYTFKGYQNLNACSPPFSIGVGPPKGAPLFLGIFGISSLDTSFSSQPAQCPSRSTSAKANASGRFVVSW